MDKQRKQFWLAIAKEIDKYGTIWSPACIDGPHNGPIGVAKALKLHNSIAAIKNPEGTIYCMVEVNLVPDIDVEINQDAVNTLNNIHKPTQNG